MTFKILFFRPAILLGLLITTSTTFAAADDRDKRQVISKEHAEFFETKIRPVLSKNCYSCHGRKKQEEGIRLDSRAAMIEGGDSGEVLVPGSIDDSLIIDVLHRDEGQMPPGKRLSESEIADLEKWVKLDAPWPAAPHGSDNSNNTPKLDKDYWAFQPLSKVLPKSFDNGWIRNEIDQFVYSNFESKELQPNPAATKNELLRRLFFDMLGVPPSIKEQDQFLYDKSDDAYEKLVDRLLADKRYGEKWGRHWLDLVRYAESDGYKQDDYRPDAWRYRDYVIKAFNDDKPYDQFVMQQLAGDEIDSTDPENLVATGYLRHWIYEYNQRDVRTQWDTILNDITNVTGDVFLATSMNCARCHDHKFDPVLQKDYFRLKAFFAPLLPRDDVPLATPEQLRSFEEKQKEWLEKTANIRKEIEEIEAPYHAKKMNPEIGKFPLDIRPMMKKNTAERTSFELQLTDLAFRQVSKLTEDELAKKLKGGQKERWDTLRKKLSEFDAIKPKSLPKVLTVTDTGRNAPQTFITDDHAAGPINPGVLSVMDPTDFKVSTISKSVLERTERDNRPTTGRRFALAKWITSPENPLTTRVIVNRIWQYHFGEGIVRSSSDFGTLGQPPADPKLLDWLTRRFIDGGWKFKSLHKLILMSATYRQKGIASANPSARPFQQVTRRLDAEQIRDAILSVSGELDPKRGGPGADSSDTRRTIYNKIIRNRRDPLLDVFDAPDNFNSTAQRNKTTTPTQSLLMINGSWALARSKAFAKRISKISDNDSQIELAYRLAYGRLPSHTERGFAEEFLATEPKAESLVDFCHVLLNSNEFLYVD